MSDAPLASDAQVAAVKRALCDWDAWIATRGSPSMREVIGAIVAALATAPVIVDDERVTAALTIARERAVGACRQVLDEREESRAEQASRDARGTEDELARLRHWATVSTFNAGVRRCIAAISSST